MDTLIQDLRYGLRMLARNPGFTAVAVLTLAIGIGATTAIFSFVNAVILRPLPYADSGRLTLVSSARPNGEPGPFSAVTAGDFLDWQASNTVFDDMAAFAGNTLSLTGAGEPERLYAATVTTGFFRTLGVQPLLGRTFAPSDDPGRVDSTVVISETLWRRRFRSDAAVIGDPITLDGRPLTIVAVMPAHFTFPLDIFRFPGARAWRPPEAWTVFTPEPGYRNNATHRVVARLKRDVTVEQANAAMTALAARIAERLPANRRGGARVEPLSEPIVREVRPLLFLFLGGVAFVLLIACVNDAVRLRRTA